MHTSNFVQFRKISCKTFLIEVLIDGYFEISNFTMWCSNVVRVRWKSLWQVHRGFPRESVSEGILKISLYICRSYDQKLSATLSMNTVYKLEAIQRWSAICRVWPWTLTYQKFLLCISSQVQGLSLPYLTLPAGWGAVKTAPQRWGHKVQGLYSHQKLYMYIYWFLSVSGYSRQRRRRRRWTPQYNH